MKVKQTKQVSGRLVPSFISHAFKFFFVLPVFLSILVLIYIHVWSSESSSRREETPSLPLTIDSECYILHHTHTYVLSSLPTYGVSKLLVTHPPPFGLLYICTQIPPVRSTPASTPPSVIIIIISSSVINHHHHLLRTKPSSNEAS